MYVGVSRLTDVILLGFLYDPFHENPGTLAYKWHHYNHEQNFQDWCRLEKKTIWVYFIDVKMAQLVWEYFNEFYDLFVKNACGDRRYQGYIEQQRSLSRPAALLLIFCCKLWICVKFIWYSTTCQFNLEYHRLYMYSLLE